MAFRRFNRWTRDLHMYAGLFISPFVVVFALSVFFLNHAWLPWGGMSRAEVRTDSSVIRVPEMEDDLALARAVQREIGVAGEIDFISRDVSRGRLSFPIRRPGIEADVRVAYATGETIVRTRRTGLWDGMVRLHRMPGPHNVAVRGNWVYTRAWGVLADATVYLLLFVTVTGVLIWLTLRSERRSGLMWLGGGVLTFVGLVLAIVGRLP